MSEDTGPGATALGPDAGRAHAEDVQQLRQDMNTANATVLQKVAELDVAVDKLAHASPIDLPDVGTIAELATERIEERMGDLEDVLSRMAEANIAWPDENVDAAMAAVQAEIGGLEVGKTANIVSTKGSYSYSYITEGQITAEVRRRLSSRGVAIWVSEVSSVKEGSLTTVTLDVTFAHARSGTERVIRMSGQGTDPGDKGHTKAATTAIRVGFCKQFLQSGDLDPEDSNYDHTSTPIAQASAPPAAPANGRQAVYDVLARWTGGDVDQLKAVAAAMGVTSIKGASDEQLQTMQDFIGYVRGSDHDAMQTRVTDEGWPAIAKLWYQTEGSITL